MMKSLFALVLLFEIQVVRAESIQVPEKCAARTAPCLIKTQSEDYKFSYKGYEISLAPETIIKISLDQDHVNFDLLNGYLNLEKTGKEENTASIDTVMVDSRHVMASRQEAVLQVLSLQHFVLSEYQIQGTRESYAVRSKSGFANKTDLIQFVKNHFSKVSEMRQFLTSIEDDWSKEFRHQNDLQTKALMRSVASEEEASQKKAEERRAVEEQRKKARNELFYRTFER